MPPKLLLCSLFDAPDILVLDRYGKSYSGIVMTAMQLLVLGVGCTVIYAIAKPAVHVINWSWQLVAIILASALVSSTFATWIQTRYQADTTPDRAALIFNLEPVFATIFATWWLHEAVGLNIIVGGSLILAAIIVPTVAKRLFDNKARTPT